MSEASTDRNFVTKAVIESMNVRGTAVGVSGREIYSITLLENSYSPPQAIFTAEAVNKGITKYARTLVVGKPSVILPSQQIYSDRRSVKRPPDGGVSIGNVGSNSAGTLGGVLKINDRAFILSNSHVFGPYNSHIGDDITQPGVIDGGNSSTIVAKFYDDAPPLIRGPNYVDAAIAEPTVRLTTNILEIGNPTGITNVMLNGNVRKSGRTTDLTYGTVIASDATVKVDYGDDLILFKNQFIIQGLSVPFSQPGDSGSLIVDDGRKVMGLLFAGSEYVTFANPISSVLERFGADLWTWQ